MRNVKLLCQDVVECASGMLSKEIAVSLLLDQLRDLGWSDGDGTQPERKLSFEQFAASVQSHLAGVEVLRVT